MIGAGHRQPPVDATGADSLNPRELEVLRLMCDGLSTKQIAAAVALSEGTIENYRAKLLEKAGCRTACQLGVWAVRNGVLG